MSILWGGSFLFVGVAVRELPPFTIVLLRVGLAALALHTAIHLMGIALPKEWRVWRAFCCMGFLNNVIPFTLIVWAQGHIASGVASIFNATTPLFAVVVAHYWTIDEKMTSARLAGVLVGFAGVAVMMGEAALHSFGMDAAAQIAMLAAALFYAFSGVYGRRFKAMGVEPLSTAAGMLTAASVMLVPAVLIVDQPWIMTTPGASTILAVLGLALLATALAFIIYFRILATAGATNLLLVTFLIPMSAIMLGITFLDERLGPEHVVGMASIGLGLAAIDGRPLGAASRLISGLRGSSPGTG